MVRGRVIDEQPFGMVGNELEVLPVEPAHPVETRVTTRYQNLLVAERKQVGKLTKPCWVCLGLAPRENLAPRTPMLQIGRCKDREASSQINRAVPRGRITGQAIPRVALLPDMAIVVGGQDYLLLGKGNQPVVAAGKDTEILVAISVPGAIDRGGHPIVVDKVVVQPDAEDVIVAVRPRADRPLGPTNEVIADVMVEAVVSKQRVDIVIRKDVISPAVEIRSRGIELPA